MKSDTQLLADVRAELEWDASINDRNIVVGVKDGVVTLAGSVDNYSNKWSAERITKNVAGVRAVANDLEVKLDATAKRSDGEIAATALQALQSNVAIPAADIKVLVRNGWITLEGKVGKWYQKKAAEQAVRHLWGVVGFTNDIEIRPTVQLGDVKGHIRSSFKRHADLDADKVKVELTDDGVILTGEVSSYQERESAEVAAWSAQGVSRVQNMLSVRL